MRKIQNSEVIPMTDNEFYTGRNDLIELMIEKAKRIITYEPQLETMITEYKELKH